MELNNLKKNFQSLFDKFTEDGFCLDSYHSKAILHYLESSSDKNTEKNLMETPFLSDLVLSTFLKVDKISSVDTKIFLIELTTLLLKNEFQYCRLTQRHGFQIMLSKVIDLIKTIKTPALYMAFVKLPMAQISHNIGVVTVIEHKTWTYLLNEGTHLKPTPFAEAVYDFISKLIWKLNEYQDEIYLIDLLQYIMDPIVNSEYYTKQYINVQREKRRSDQIMSYLRVLLAIFKHPEKYMQPNKVIYLLKRNFLIRGHLHYLVNASRDDMILMTTTEIMFCFYFSSIRESVVELNKSENEFLNEIMTTYNNIIKSLLHKQSATVVLNFIVKCILFWSKLDTASIPQVFELNGQKFDVRNQLVLLVVVPMLTYASCCNNEKTFVDTFFLKLIAIATEHIVKSYYMLRTFIQSGDIKKICLQGLKGIFQLKGHLNVAQAGIIFQALYYVLKSYVCHDETGGHILEGQLQSTDDLKILALVLDLLTMILTEYQITWYESFEIICFQNTLMNLMQHNSLPSKLLLQSLNLIDWSIKKFLAPDLTLLVDIKQGSTLNIIGKDLNLYLRHDEWEVRDSALQIVLTCTEVSYVKYVPLQKLISEYHLHIEAASLALTDDSYYVQAMALRCLAAATKIETIWNEVVSYHPQLYVKLLNLVLKHDEGIVRKEAVNLLTELYVHQKFTTNYLNYLYAVMKRMAINDLYWEVQMSSLKFWKHVIKTFLSDRGMIDGKFPSVTFSKDKRKIVTLNNIEIMKQLVFLMNTLSSNGCLTVLCYCLHDDCSIRVMEEAYNIAKDLVDILDNYKFDMMFEDELMDLTTQIENYALKMEVEDFYDSNISKDNVLTINREFVIEGILDKNCSDLIEDMLNQQEITMFSVFKKSDPLPFIQYKEEDPRSFIVKFKQTDYLTLISSKKSWSVGNLETLLNDILIF